MSTARHQYSLFRSGEHAASMGFPRGLVRCSISGASILLTLVVISGMLILLTILARLVMVERRVSAGYSELERADMAAKAGAEDASNLLLQLFMEFPDSATYWEPKIADTATPGTVFMFQDRAFTDGVAAMTNQTNPKVYARPLISGATTEEFYPDNKFSETFPANVITDPAQSVDLNEPGRYGARRNNRGWIGAPPGLTPSPVRVPWVNILEDPSQPEDKVNNRVVARYAYWIEDESFKLNVNTAKAAARGAPTDDDAPSLQGLFEPAVAEAVVDAREKLAGATGGVFLSPLQVNHADEVPSGVAPEEFGAEYSYLLTTTSSGLNLSRSGAKRLDLNKVVGNGHSTASEIGVAVGQIEAAIKKQVPDFGQRFFRLQTGSILQASTATTAPQKNSYDVPDTTTQPYASLYIKRIAANIYDYISPSPNPTVFDKGGKVQFGNQVYLSDFFETAPIKLSSDRLEDNGLPVIGKKRVPYFTEYMVNAKRIGERPYTFTNPNGESETRPQLDIEQDHYFEFWNMSDQDIRPAEGDLGEAPYILVENQPAISSDNNGKNKKYPGYNVPQGRPFMIRLDEAFSLNGVDAPLVFRAGRITVITTDLNYSAHNLANGLSNKTTYVAKTLYPPGGTIPYNSVAFSEPPFPEGEGSATAALTSIRRYRMLSFDSGELQVGPDMEGSTTMMLSVGNKNGILSGHIGISLGIQSQNAIVYRYSQGDRANMYRGSHVGGDIAGLYDPRGSLEAIKVYRENRSAVENTVTVRNSSMMALNGQEKVMQHGASSHLGEIRQSEFSKVNAASTGNHPLWNTDPITRVQGAANAPMILRGDSMKSIGELGHIFDPIGHSASTLAVMERRRMGGRTLTIGQADFAWDGTRTNAVAGAEMQYQTSASRQWTAWRLADIFTVRKDDEMGGDPEHPENRSEVPGLYNPNGILRDGGRTLKALIEGIVFSGNIDAALLGKTVNSTDTEAISMLRDSLVLPLATDGGQSLSTYLAQRLSREYGKRFSPLWEPGEISQLYLFNPANGEEQFVKGSKLIDISDRGREELARRLMDYITAKGNTFTIYVVGQSMRRQPPGATGDPEPIATKAQRITVRLRPVYEDGRELNDEFDPTDDAAVKERFRKPDSYTLHIISVEDA